MDVVKLLFRRGLVAVAALFLLLAPVRAQPAGTSTVRFGSVGGATDAGLYLAEEFGYFKQAGITLSMTRMPNAPTLLTALATGQLDVAGISLTPGIFTAVQQGIDIRIVGDKQSIRPGFSATRLVVGLDLWRGSAVASIAGLKGRNVAVSAKASSAYRQLIETLADNGLSIADVRAVELAYPNMVPALTSHAVDAGVLLEPFLSQSIELGIGRMVSDLIPDRQRKSGASEVTVPLVYSEKFAENRKIAQAFMTAYVKGVRLYNDAFVKNENKEKVIEIIARHAGIDAKLIRDGFPAGLDPDQRVNVAALEGFQQFFVEQHFMRDPIDVNKVVDSSFAEASVKQLGSYR